MNSQYDVYMCRCDQLISEAKTLAGKPIHLIHSPKYKKIFDEIINLGYRVRITHDGGNIINRNCVAVLIDKQKGA